MSVANDYTQLPYTVQLGTIMYKAHVTCHRKHTLKDRCREFQELIQVLSGTSFLFKGFSDLDKLE